MSPAKNVKVDGLTIKDEDIVRFDYFTQSWTMIFDGSDVGIANVDIDGFHLWYGSDNILMSFDKPIKFPVLGWIDDSDIVRFIPSSLGTNTAGTWELFFDGSDYELTTNGEDIDGISMSPSGDLLISTTGTARVANIKALDEDILRFGSLPCTASTAVACAQQTGQSFSGIGGTWSLYFDGTDIRLSNGGGEDVNGISVNSSNGNISLTTKGNFQAQSLNLVNGDSDDIFSCEVPSLNTTTPCVLTKLFDGDDNMWRKDIDGISIVPGSTAVSRLATQAPESDIEGIQYEVAVEDNSSDESDTELDEFDRNQDEGELELFIPIVTR